MHLAQLKILSGLASGSALKSPGNDLSGLARGWEMRLRHGEIRIEGLGKRYSFRSRAPEEEEEEEEEDVDDVDEDGESRGNNFGLIFGRRTEIWALRDVFCHVEPGERIAVIGTNGAGKTTLIRILSRTLPPSEGTVEGAGSVVPFAALSGAISAQRSGCDNLRMLARLLSLPLERLEQRLPEIIEFSELGSLAHEKVFRYSSKSFARLSMAMALCVDADIYLIDDGLSFSDQIYQKKAREKFEEVLGRNRTLIFASNNLRELKLYCRRALWLDGGKLVGDGEFDAIAERYLTHRQHMSQAAADPDRDQGNETTADPSDVESPDVESPSARGPAQPVTLIDDHRRALKRAK
jgi:ABC-type polysaccharide/polyol phosphate transport system ATPase subunit